MCILEQLRIDLKEVGKEPKTFHFDLDEAYFKAIKGEEVKDGKVAVDVVARETAGLYGLDFHTEGIVIVTCDRCLDDMEQDVTADNKLAVRLGEAYSDEDEIITVEREGATLDVAWFVYEFIALSLPVKHVHAPGKCNRAMIEAVEAHSATRSSDESDKPIDPRWSILGQLKTKNEKTKI